MSTVQDVFRQFYDEYCFEHGIDYEYNKVANAIIQCKTGQLGYNTMGCDDCGHTHGHANSCRNRNCPGCQVIPREVWVDARKAEVIDNVPYYHVVFTIPEALNRLVFANRKELYSLLHKCTSQTILELAADRKYLGGIPGIIQVLHTWGQQVNYHPHIHAIVTGCGLTEANQAVKSSGFFIPIKVLSRKFRGKFICLLNKLHDQGKLNFSSSISHLEEPHNWGKYIKSLNSIEWVPYIKKTFNGSGDAIEYLGKYTHRVAISNYRILNVSKSEVTFKYQDYRDGQHKEMTVPGVEFVRRFLMHVLPKGFVKIRYYGMLNNRLKKKKLKLIRTKMQRLEYKAKLAGLKMKDLLKILFGVDLSRCPECGSSNYHVRSRCNLRN